MPEGECIVTDADGAMVYASDSVVPPRTEWLDLDWWRAQGGAWEFRGGRGSVAYVEVPGGEAVLRHYRRGGLVARWLLDRYAWHGIDRTRSFLEFRLVRRLSTMGLPVPAVLAARYRRVGRHFYTADILTRRITAAETLAQRLLAGGLDAALASRVGALIARFHRAGLDHADLNAHNVLLNPSGLYLIDFDRCRLRRPTARWQRSNLKRLRRSLLKLGACGGDATKLDATLWPALLGGWRAGLTT